MMVMMVIFEYPDTWTFLSSFCSYSGNSKQKICGIVTLDFFPQVCSRKILIFRMQTNQHNKINIALFQELHSYFCPEKEFSTAGEVFLKIYRGNVLKCV
jgi:hypothetical protein